MLIGQRERTSVQDWDAVHGAQGSPSASRPARVVANAQIVLSPSYEDNDASDGTFRAAGSNRRRSVRPRTSVTAAHGNDKKFAILLWAPALMPSAGSLYQSSKFLILAVVGGSLVASSIPPALQIMDALGLTKDTILEGAVSVVVKELKGLALQTVRAEARRGIAYIWQQHLRPPWI
ncbi:hypothetical protein EXIGLDRAFT_743832 [Exidia glandulosa HHB12029]|uniref:Uncharacterized protein n=1 Tax=Exidia glandulosa HHB12029 TaxID=1314781 RepID=A0A165R1M2_EXIGL|nr:hypothetical protein EXIGLDRAFT_743832 [Exidia glandulosa HHB12029]